MAWYEWLLLIALLPIGLCGAIGVAAGAMYTFLYIPCLLLWDLTLCVMHAWGDHPMFRKGGA